MPGIEYFKYRPPWTYRRAEPMSPIKVDEHVDGDRIWATIQHIRQEFEVEEAELHGEIRNLATELEQKVGDHSFSEYEIMALRNAFTDLVAPGGLTKSNMTAFQRLFDDLLMRLQDLT